MSQSLHALQRILGYGYVLGISLAAVKHKNIHRRAIGSPLPFVQHED
jgi:hypothetical protein